MFAFFILPQFYAHSPAGILTYLSTNSSYLHVGYIQKNISEVFYDALTGGMRMAQVVAFELFPPKIFRNRN